MTALRKLFKEIRYILASCPINVFLFTLQSGVYDDLGDDRLNFGTPNGVNDVIVTAASAPNGGVSMVTSESFYPASATIRGQYSIAPATTIINGHPKTYHTIVNVSHQPKNHWKLLRFHEKENNKNNNPF